MTAVSEGVVDLDIATDVPTRPPVRRTAADRIFRAVATIAAATSLVIVGATFVFLVNGARPALSASGIWSFLSRSVWDATAGQFGVYGLLIGSVIIATIAFVFAVPLSLAMALFINEYAPRRIKRPLTSVIDLLAALPSLLFGLWGFKALQPEMQPIASWMSTHLNVLPFLELSRKDAAVTSSSFIAGVVVAIMIVPIVTSITRDVMAQAPRDQCEGALALGGTRWSMIREVILPFSRSGIVGASLLGFGRAVGETIAVALIISSSVEPQYHILELGGSAAAPYIAVKFPEAGELERSGLIGVGLALFLITFFISLMARIVVRRSALKT
jgi:phosphate transport system permease protein